MLRMVSTDGVEYSRRRVPLSELDYDGDENGRRAIVLDQLRDARLVVQGKEGEAEPYVEPAHDKLIKGWDLLWDWIVQRKSDLFNQRRLTPDAVAWGADPRTTPMRFGTTTPGSRRSNVSSTRSRAGSIAWRTGSSARVSPCGSSSDGGGGRSPAG